MALQSKWHLPTWFGLLTSVALVAITAISLFRSKRKKDARRAELHQWIKKALQEREEKVHTCLDHAAEDHGPRMLTAAETRDQVASGKLDPSMHVVRLAKRCRRYGRGASNAITEELYDEAFEAAKILKSRGTKAKHASLLLGVPISVKDCIGLKGTFSTGGLACRLAKRDEQDSLIVQVLKSSGALPLCRGNVPQILMLPESTNFIWGRSRNPWNLDRTPGGSSGGDGALVAMGCVPLAICSDVAGSIRIPAAFCGVTGFKPTSTRLSNKGNMTPRQDNKSGTLVAIPVVLGPIARSVDCCALFMKSVCVPEHFSADLNIPPLPFNEAAYQSSTPLKIGYFSTDGWFEPCESAKRGLQETVDALTRAGHKCVQFEPPTDGWLSYGLLVSINGAEGNFRSFRGALEGEALIPEYDTLATASDLPNWLRWMVRKVIDERRSHLLGSTRSGGVSVWDLWQRTAELVQMRAMWSDAFQASGVDAILHPALPLPALPHGISGDMTSAFSYMFLANMLLWPAGVVPVTLVRENEQHYSIDELPMNQRDFMAKLAMKSMEKSAGLPMSVSVMTPAFQDEQCLRVMKEVERVVAFSAEPTAYKTVS